MTEEKLVQIQELYEKEFPENMSFEQASAKLDTMNTHPDIQALRKMFCNGLVFALTEGFVKYDDKELVAYDGSLLKLVYENIEKLDKNHHFYWAFYYYLKKQYKKCKEFIHKLCQEEAKIDSPLNEDGVLDLFLVPLKNAPDEIWKCITEEVKAITTEAGIPEFCDVISLYYRSTNNDEVVDALLTFMQKYPNYKSPNEMLGYTYYNMSMSLLVMR